MTETFDNKEIIKPRHFGVIYGYRFPDGKWYVGQSKNIDKRHKRHKSPSDQYVWRAAWSKYGEQQYIILKICANQKEMDRCEQLFIRMHNAVKPNGYCKHGGGQIKRTGETHPETSALISKNLMGNKHGVETLFLPEEIERRRRDAMGNKNALGLKHTQKTKDIIRAKMKVRVFTPEHRANISKAQTGKPISDKKRAALSAGQMRRRARERAEREQKIRAQLG